MYKVFIDGKAGTTGLRVYERLAARSDIELISLSEEERKNTALRRQAMSRADMIFLCLPDDAAREAAAFEEAKNAVIIDASTAHRTDEAWSYGLPELSPSHRERIACGKRIAVPGCHASGFNALIYPLISMSIMPRTYPLSCFSITGYSGGGKSMIAEYENKDGRDALYGSPRQYALGQTHKHLKEMKYISTIDNEPLFSPLVADFYSGMQVTVPIYPALLNKKLSPQEIHEVFAQHYNGALINVAPFGSESAFMAANALSGMDTMTINICGNNDRALLIATYDNLGKGASGAAVQCMNIIMDVPENTGLIY